jgi:branched-chain amino acid transport system ATP-binding protein
MEWGRLNKMELLKIDKLSMHFGGLKAIQNLDMSIQKGQIKGLIGPNGAGKTTLFNVISGAYKQTYGTITFKGKDISTLKPYQTAGLGLVRTFQEITQFKNFSVLKAVMIGCHLNSGYNFFSALFNTPYMKRQEARNREKSMEILEFMGLAELKDELALNLPNGHQRALGISVALAAKPDLLLLDEPVTGMNPEETDEMMKLINKIRDKGISILIIEHDMKVVMGLCDEICVINFGTKIAEGSPKEIQTNKKVLEAYLGSE